MSKKSCFSGCIGKQYGKHSQALLKYVSKHLYRIHCSLERKFCSKKFPLLTRYVLGLLINTLAPDEKYPVLNRNNLTLPIRMQLSQKQKPFSQFFAAFLKFRLIFEHFEKKKTLRAFLFPKLRTRKTWLNNV